VLHAGLTNHLARGKSPNAAAFVPGQVNSPTRTMAGFCFNRRAFVVLAFGAAFLIALA